MTPEQSHSPATSPIDERQAETPALARAADLIGQASASIAEARRRLDRNELIDLTPIVPLLTAAGEEMKTIPVIEARALRSRLTALLDEVTRMSCRLIEERDAAGAALHDVSARRRATSAYASKNRS